jgi:transcriptional regulator with XRE-family HTH domain
MRGTNYLERDHTFGQMMLTMRTRVGLSQAELARMLGVSRKAIGDWERGSSYPTNKHLQQFIALAIQHRAFPAGREVEEVRAIWQGAHQRVLFDETWLTPLLPQPEASPSFQSIQQAEVAAEVAPAPRVDWNNAMALPAFYGREQEIDLLIGWVVADRCRVVCVQGIGGIGKSALAISLMHRVSGHFEVVIWRSMRDLSTCEELLKDLLQVFHPQSLSGEPTSLLRSQDNLLEQMRKFRVLLVLDNFEAVLEEEVDTGRMRPGFEGLERVLRLATETEHQSCVLLTSREKPTVLVPLEGGQATVRSLRLAPLDAQSCDKLLSEKELIGSVPERMRLIEAYTGNPLALKIVANTIIDLFDGEIVPFLEKGEVIIGGIRTLLEEQFYRLSSLGKSLLLWFMSLREPATIDKLLEMWEAPISRPLLLEALDSLYRRSLIERGSKPHEFALQSLVMEYLKTWLITQETLKSKRKTRAPD